MSYSGLVLVQSIWFPSSLPMEEWRRIQICWVGVQDPDKDKVSGPITPDYT
jgi:hypothetical protein